MRISTTIGALVSAILLVTTGAALGNSGENIALGKSYVLSHPPNYDLCKDAGDVTQLTDGHIGAGALWGQPATVGWSHHSRPMVTIDLERISSISGVRFNVAGGGHAGVYFPAVTLVLVSDDGAAFRIAGAVGTGTLVQDTTKAYTHQFVLADLNARGRYVRLVFQPEERYVFIDEIEVYDEGAGAAGEKDGATPISDEQIDRLMQTGVAARWVISEWNDVQKQIEQMNAQGENNRELASRVAEIEHAVGKLNVVDEAAIEALRVQYYLLRAEVARPAFKSDFVCQTIDPLADWRGSIFPARDKPTASPTLSMSMWRDEHESAAVLLANLAPHEKRVKLRVSPLGGESGRQESWQNRLWLREARAIPVRLGYRVLDPLVLLASGDGANCELILPAGETRVVWLTLRALELESGQYQAAIDIEPSEGDRQTIALKLAVADGLRMPSADELALNSCHWDYLRGWNAPPEAAGDLRAHGANMFILHPESLPQLVLNADRTKLESVNFEIFDEALARAGTPVPRYHGVFWGEEAGFKLFDLQKPVERDLFKQWIAAWAKHLADKGIGPDRYFFYPFDEKIPQQFVEVARLIKEVDPNLQVYCNQVNAEPAMIEQIASYIDIWSPYYKTFTSELTEAQRAALKTAYDSYQPKIWSYACDGPGKTMSPDTYYRSLSWLAFDNGANGAGFWCYADGDGGWDDYQGAVHYGLVYYTRSAPPDVSREEAIVPSRRWEAWREGVEDYQYLHELKRAIEDSRGKDIPASRLERAEQALKQSVDNVLNKHDALDRYNHAREQLTQMILELRGG